MSKKKRRKNPTLDAIEGKRIRFFSAPDTTVVFVPKDEAPLRSILGSIGVPVTDVLRAEIERRMAELVEHAKREVWGVRGNPLTMVVEGRKHPRKAAKGGKK